MKHISGDKQVASTKKVIKNESNQGQATYAKKKEIVEEIK